jgi:hypothetical protein
VGEICELGKVSGKGQDQVSTFSEAFLRSKGSSECPRSQALAARFPDEGQRIPLDFVAAVAILRDHQAQNAKGSQVVS